MKVKDFFYLSQGEIYFTFSYMKSISAWNKQGIKRLHLVLTLELSLFDGAAYCIVAVESVGRDTPIAFLDRVKDDFNKRYGGGKAANATANSLTKEFG